MQIAIWSWISSKFFSSTRKNPDDIVLSVWSFYSLDSIINFLARSNIWNALTICPKVILEKSRGGRFYGTGIEIWAGFGPNGRLSCLHSFKIFWSMKPSYTSNEMIKFVAHLDVSKIYEILKECFKLFMGYETFSIVSCSIGDTSSRDFSTMTLICPIDTFYIWHVQYCGTVFPKDIHAYST